MPRRGLISPIRVFAIVLGVVFLLETSIMLLVESGDTARGSRLFLSLLDAIVLVAVLWPVLWFLVVRPMRATIAERDAFLSRTLTIQETERANLARELHDELGQTQTAVLLGARSILAAPTLEDAKERAEEVARMAASSMESSRRIARGLGPGVLTDLGLGVAAERLCEEIASASGLEIERTVRLGSGRFDPETEIVVYRVLQEALNNAAKHARATRVGVQLEAVDGTIRLVVSDNGVGMPGGAGARVGRGYGLQGMRERVTLQRGTFAITSGPGSGATVTASIPLDTRRTQR